MKVTQTWDIPFEEISLAVFAKYSELDFAISPGREVVDAVSAVAAQVVALLLLVLVLEVHMSRNVARQ